MTKKTARLGLFLRDTAPAQDPASEGAGHLLPRTPELIRLRGQRIGLLVADDGETTKACYAKVVPPFIEKGSVRPGSITTTAVYHAHCAWCGDLLASAGDLVKKAAKTKGFDRKSGAKGAIQVLTSCPECWKPLVKGWAPADPFSQEGRGVFPETPGFVDECVDRVRAASGQFELPAIVGAYPMADGYTPTPPWTCRERFARAQAVAETRAVLLNSGRSVNGLALVDAEQLPASPSPPIAWFLLLSGQLEATGVVPWGLINDGWRSGVNVKINLRVLLQPRRDDSHRGGGFAGDDLVI